MANSVNFNMGSDYDFYNRVEKNNVNYSNFDLSYIHTTNLFAGDIVPVALYETVPGDNFNLDLSFLLKTVPMKVPVMSSYKIFFHAFYCSCYDMWRDFKNFVTRGRSGTYESTPPYLDFKSDIVFSRDTCQRSLWSYFGLPQLHVFSGTSLFALSSDSNDYDVCSTLSESLSKSDVASSKISAFPFFMYQRIKRDYFTLSPDAVIQTIGQDVLYPDDDDNIQLVSGANIYFNKLQSAQESENNSYIELSALRQRDWRGDYFTASMPSEQRGNPPTLSLSSAASFSVDIPSVVANPVTDFVPIYFTNSSGQNDALYAIENGSVVWNDDADAYVRPITLGALDAEAQYVSSARPGYYLKTDLPNYNVPSHSASVQTATFLTNIGMNDLRVLSALNLWQERNGRTRGDYDSEIIAHFGVDPQIPDHRPQYIGSFYDDVYFSEVVQQSESGTTPLGETAGRGVSTASGSLGSWRSRDFGYIMVVASILPDVSYAQGVDKMWTRHTFADYYYPEFNNLGPDVILNKELNCKFDNSGDGSVGSGDNNVFAWQNRFDEYRFRRNIATGAIGNPDLTDWHTWTYTRWFSGYVPYSLDFMRASPNNDAFVTGSADFPFILQVANRTRASRPLPYFAMPSSLGMR